MNILDIPPNWFITLEFKKEDLLVGLYWDVFVAESGNKYVDYYLCLIPCFPIHILRFKKK